MFFPEKKSAQIFLPKQSWQKFMQILPQTLNKAVQEGRNSFRFHGKGVKVIQQKIPHFALFDLSSSDTPIETFETVSDVAKWLKVRNQAVYAAINRGLETRLKNKKKEVFLLRKIQETEQIQEKNEKVPVSSAQEKIPPVPLPRKAKAEKEKIPPVPLPRKKRKFPLFLFREKQKLKMIPFWSKKN